MLKNFVSLTSQVIQCHEVDAKCISLLDDSELLRKEIVSAIRNTRATTMDTIDRFYERNSSVFSSVAGLQSAGGNTFLTDVKTSLAKMLVDVETNSSQQQEKYKENIRSIINANRVSAINAVKDWLSDENRNFPRPVLASLSVELAARIDPATNNNSYKVIRTASAAAATATAATTAPAVTNKKEGEGKKGSEKATVATTAPARFSYILGFESAGVEFWNYRKKVLDLGIKELVLPVGMKLPMSEKVKNTFRLGSRKEAPAKEPHFTKADDFYIYSVALHGEKTLEVWLTSDVAGPAGDNKGELFTIVFDVASLPDPSARVAPSASSSANPVFSTTRPRIHYTDNRGGEQATMSETDLLQIKEIEQATDLNRLAMFGTAVLANVQILGDPGILALKGKLKLLTVEEKEAIAMSRHDIRTAAAGSGASAATALVFVEFPLLFDLLEALARSFGPVVEKLKEKTPVKEELILRQESEGGQRKEFAVKLDDLRSQLGETPYGKSVFRIVIGA
jgi:hypothetical protein